MTSEFKVGVVVLVGIVLLFYMSVRVGKFGVLQGKGYEVVAYFNNAAGLDVKSPVELAGVEVGRIKSITLEGYRAKTVLQIKEGVQIPADSQLAIKSMGILGDKYLAVTPGQSTTYLKNRDQIKQVTAYADYDEIFATVNVAARNFGETVEQFKDILGEKDKENIRSSIASIRTASNQFSSMLAENRSGVRAAVTSLAAAGEKLGPVAQSAGSILRDLEEGKGTLGLLIKDDALYKDTKDTMASLRNITGDIEQGKGTMGKLFKDEALYDDTKETARNFRELAEGINKGQGTLGKLAKDETLATEAEKTLKKVQKAAEGLQEQTPITILGTILGVFF